MKKLVAVPLDRERRGTIMKKLVAVSLIVVFLMSVSGGAEASPGPDLEIVSVSVESNPTNPSNVRVEVSVRNNGDTDAGPFVMRWYPLRATDEIGCSIEVPGLSAHKRGTARCSYTYVSTGTKHWRAVVDEELEIAEDNESNNEQTGTIVIGGSQQPGNTPDLVIQNAHFEPAQVAQGQEFRAVMTVVNRGGVAVTEPFSVLWHFHEALDLEDCVWQFGQGIGPGAGLEVSCPRTTDANPGQTPTWVTVDTDNVISESNEANNDVDVTMVIGESGQRQPDLLITEVYFEPDPPITGEEFTAVMRIRNASNVDVTEPFSALWEFDEELGLEDCVWQLEDGLAAGHGLRLSCRRTTDAIAGHAPTAPTVDAYNAIAESDEINNDMPVTLVLAARDFADVQGPPVGPDLAIRDLEVTPDHAIPGQELTVEFDVVNRGSEQAGASEVVWWSGSGAQGYVTWDVPALTGGASHHIEDSNVTAPSTPGVYSYLAWVNPAGLVDEDGTNNMMTVEDGLQVMAMDHPDPQGPPDLIVRNLEVTPNPVNRGYDLLIEFEVVNEGRGTAAASVAEWTLPPAADLSVQWNVPALQIGESFRCTRQVAAPSDKKGYGNRAIADVDNVVDEWTEDNNVLRGETLVVQ